MRLPDDMSSMQVRSGIALGTLLLLLGLMYFGRFLPEGSAGLEIEHPHTKVECQTCHTFGSKADTSGSLLTDNQNCQSCHFSTLDSHSPFHSSSTTRQCADCHSFHKPEFVFVAGDTMTLEFAGKAGALCADCHKEDGLMPEVSAGHREAARLIHSQQSLAMAETPSEYCLACHSNESGGNNANENVKPAPRFHLSASHVFGQRVIAGSQQFGSAFRIPDELPSHLVLIDGKIECQTCHSMISDEVYQLSQTIEDGLCGGCHQRIGGERMALEFSSKL